MGMVYRIAKVYESALSAYREALSRAGDSPFGELPEGDLLALGDNEALMKRLLAQGREGSFDFIYIDPPFCSDSNYKARIPVSGKIVKMTVYEDKWDGGLAPFLSMLAERLMLMRDLLKSTGLIAVHLDGRAVHYVKILMDEIFGPSAFVNELVWSYKSGGASSRSFARKHDTILLYSRSSKYYFKPGKERSYNRGYKPYRFEGVEEFEDEDGRWYTMVNRKDVLNVDMVGRTSSERTGYATQKPVRLLEILLDSCCPEGGLCADFFCGSGSLGAAALAGGRRFVLCDRSPIAFNMAKKRLEDAGAQLDTVTAADAVLPRSVDELPLSGRELRALKEMISEDPSALDALGALYGSELGEKGR